VSRPDQNNTERDQTDTDSYADNLKGKINHNDFSPTIGLPFLVLGASAIIDLDIRRELTRLEEAKWPKFSTAFYGL